MPPGLVAAARPSPHTGATARVLLVLLSVVMLSGSTCVSPAAAASGSSATWSPAADRPAPSRGVWPLQPRPDVVAGFEPPAVRWGAGHRGVDLAGHLGQAVHTSLAGRVSFAGTLAGRGVVVVAHGSTRTTYEPVGATVSVGDRVEAGDVLGHLQLFGSHCFPRTCLHWGLIEGRSHYLDPLTLVGAAPVRLLPLGGPPRRSSPWAEAPVAAAVRRPNGPLGRAPRSMPTWTPLLPDRTPPWLLPPA